MRTQTRLEEYAALHPYARLTVTKQIGDGYVIKTAGGVVLERYGKKQDAESRLKQAGYREEQREGVKAWRLVIKKARKGAMRWK